LNKTSPQQRIGYIRTEVLHCTSALFCNLLRALSFGVLNPAFGKPQNAVYKLLYL